MGVQVRRQTSRGALQVRGRQNGPKDGHTLAPGTCECHVMWQKGLQVTDPKTGALSWAICLGPVFSQEL